MTCQTALTTLFLLLAPVASFAQEHNSDALRAELKDLVESKAKLTQEIVDSVFSFAEVGFHEFKTMEYLTAILKDAGFEIETGVAGMPSAWVATWSNGEGPAISFNSDVDGLPGISQYPGLLEQKPIVEGGDGHGEGHNSGIALTVVSALSVKELMEKHGLTGTPQVWPGTAEEALGGKQWYIAAGVLDDMDIVINNHIGNTMAVSWGQRNLLTMASVEYNFHGVSAHAAGSPWMGRSALDAVELMNIGWNFRREHLRPEQRSHYVINNGGLQPNIVPDEASVWYYFRNISPESVLQMLEIADGIAEGASLMTSTTWDRRILGSAWPNHGNKPLTEAMQANIEEIGMPAWTEDDQAYAKAVQEAIGVAPIGLRTEVNPMDGPVAAITGGGSDDIGQVMWVKPTVRLSFPAQIAGTTSHNWQAALAVATPIAHKAAVAGAKVTALTALDVLLNPALIDEANAYFEEQTKELKYFPFEGETDKPAIHLNSATSPRNAALQEEFYYDPSKFGTYLEQLNITYPQLPTAP